MSRPWLDRLRKSLSRATTALRILSSRTGSRRAEQRSDAPEKTYQSAKSLGFSLTRLNTDAARRQAKLGKNYARSAQTPKLLKELRQGAVTLPPHGSWTGDYTEWDADPFNDRNWRFQFHTLRWINPYLWDALAGNDESRREWKRIVQSWTETNTPHHRAKDEFAWKDMTDGNRAIQLSIGAPLIDSNDGWYLDLLVEHRNWLLDEDNITEGNHGLHQNLGLFVVAVVLNDDVGAQRAIQRLGDQVLQAFDEKGLNEEGSVGYHQMNLVWWREAERRLKLEGYALPTTAADRLEKAGRTMGHLLLPDGTMPQIGDGSRGNGRRGLHPFLDQVVKGKINDSSLETFQHYPNGFTIFRSGWGETQPLSEESHTVVRHGRDLLRHSHNDRGSVHIYTSGRRWITDGGFHSYQQGHPDRVYTKSRLAHSLVDIPAQSHDVTGDVPALLTEHNSDDVMSVELLDDNFESAVWQRRIVYLPELNVWVVWDRVESESPDYVQQQWLMEVDLEVNQLSNDVLELKDKYKKLQMQWFGDQPAIDITVGDLSSESRRGLIGVRWKTMEPTTSVHAVFHAARVESIVVISDPDEYHMSINITEQEPLESFQLRLSTSEQHYYLDFLEEATQLTRGS